MRTEGMAKTLVAGAAVAARRIVKFGSSDTAVIQAAAATDSSIGVSDLGAASGEYCDVIMDGIALVEYGGNVTRGDLLTADADGKAVLANPGANAENRVVGVAMKSGVAGDIGSVRVGLATIHG